jgi:hypothetical protein
LVVKCGPHKVKNKSHCNALTVDGVAAAVDGDGGGAYDDD